MRAVQDALAHGIGVDCRHQPVIEAEFPVDDLDRRRKAIGGAGSRRENLVLRPVDILVDAHDYHRVHALAGGGNNDFFGAAVKMMGKTGAILDLAC